eukprot:SAG31_NODE_631_length_13367_cov_6.190648_9_plen_124_part_00
MSRAQVWDTKFSMISNASGAQVLNFGRRTSKSADVLAKSEAGGSFSARWNPASSEGSTQSTAPKAKGTQSTAPIAAAESSSSPSPSERRLVLVGADGRPLSGAVEAANPMWCGCAGGRAAETD